MTCLKMKANTRLLLLAFVVVSCSGALEFDFRPQYHVTLPKGWIGAARSNYLLGNTNQYHVFFECHLNSTSVPPIGEREWCHAHTTDLARWSHDPLPGFPPLGTASGSVTQLPMWVTRLQSSAVGVAALQWKNKTILGISTDEYLLKFSNFTEESVLPIPPHLNISELADPYIWTDGKMYYIVVTAMRKGEDEHPAILLYRSETLTGDPFAWESEGIFWDTEKRDVQSPGFFSYFELQNPDISNTTSCMMYTNIKAQQTQWMTGKVNKTAGTFKDASNGLIDYGGTSMGSVLTDATGRAVVIGTVEESRSSTWAEQDGWSGALSLPRVIQLNEDRTTVSFPVAPEVNLLRGEYRGSYENLEVANGTLDMNAFRGDQLLIHAQLSLISTGTDFEAGIHVLSSTEEFTTISVKTDSTQQLCESGTLLEFTDLPGNDYYYFSMEEPSAKACQSACCNDIKCRAWTMVVHEPQETTNCPQGKPCCYLKSNIAQAKPSNLNLTSGTAQAVLSLSTEHSSTSSEALKKIYTAPFTGLNIGEGQEMLKADVNYKPGVGDKNFCNGQGDIEFNTYRPGLPYKVSLLDSLDPAKCRSLCCDDKHCKAWTLENSTDTSILCTLKHEVKLPESRPNYISGIGTTKYTIAVDLQIFIDHSIVEVFVNSGQSVMTARAYPRNSESVGVQLFANNSSVTFMKVEAWEMENANL